MNDQIPDFEPPPPMFEDPKPVKKPRRKPTKKARKAVHPTPQPKRIVKKRKVARRRGRPPGALGKPKIEIAAIKAEMLSDVVVFIQNVLGVTVQPWQATILRKMVREA